MSKDQDIILLPVGETTSIAEQQCPTCHEVLDATTAHSGSALPTPGDPTICLYCGEILIFGAGLQMRLPSGSELRDLQADASLWAELTTLQRQFRAAVEKHVFVPRDGPLQ